MGKEIERKWLISGLKKIGNYKHYEAKQYYIQSGDTEVRVRSCIALNNEALEDNHKPYLLTIKGNGDLTRTEVNIAIEAWDFNNLRELVKERPIEKEIIEIELDGYIIDQCCVDNGAFCYAEVEFESEEEAKSYDFPFKDILIKEVTYDKEYKMKNYWKRTRLNEV